MSKNYNSKVLVKNSLLATMTRGLGMIISYFSTPLLLSCLGQTKYGIYSSTLSIISMVYYLDLGIGSGMRNKLAACITKDDEVGIKKNIAISYLLLSIISIGIFVFFFIFQSVFDIGKFLNIYIEDENVNIILTLAILLACINFILALVNNMFYALQEAGKVQIYQFVYQIIFLSGLFIYSRSNSHLILIISILEGGAQLVKNLISTIEVFKKHPEFRFSLKDIDFSYKNGIMVFGLQVFVVQISALILNSTDSLIIQKYIGSDDVTLYNLCSKYFTLPNTFFHIAISPLWSAYTAAYTSKDYNSLVKMLKRALLLYALVFIGTIIMYFIFNPFMKIWLGKEMVFPTRLKVFMMAYYLILMFTYPFSHFTNGIGKAKEATIAIIIEAIINIPLSIFFCNNLGMGIDGVILGSVVVVTISAIIYPTITIKELRKVKSLW